MIEPVVGDLETKYGDKMDFHVVAFNEGDAPERIEQYGLRVHGMVITDAEDKKLWAESGHKQKITVVSAEIEKLLGS